MQTTSLLDRIVGRIRKNGPLTFADYMRLALYDDDAGFYATPPIGAARDFVTAPHVSRAFAWCVGRQLAGIWSALGRPEPFTVFEAGAGDGTLASAILAGAAGSDFGNALRYAGVDISSGARTALEGRGLPALAALPAEPVGAGVVLANELLDNLPFHVLRNGPGGVAEIFVAEDGGRLALVDGAPTEEAMSAAPESFSGERAVSPATAAFVRAATRAITRGYVVLFDYGVEAGVRTFGDHRLGDDVLARPGSLDITAGADFDLVAHVARGEGHAVFGPRTQRDVLLELGFDAWYAGMRSARLEAESRRDSKAILAALGEQSRAPMLVDPAHLGALKAIAIGVGATGAPPGFVG